MNQLFEDLIKIDIKKDNTYQILPTDLVLSWDSATSKTRANMFQRILGKPNAHDPSVGGFAQWRRIKFPWSILYYLRITVEDRPNNHFTGYPNILLLSIEISLKVSTRHSMIDLTPTACYEANSRILTTECIFPGAAVLTMVIIIMMNDNEITITEARQFQAHWISKLSDEWDNYQDNPNDHSLLIQGTFEKYIYSNSTQKLNKGLPRKDEPTDIHPVGGVYHPEIGKTQNNAMEEKDIINVVHSKLDAPYQPKLVGKRFPTHPPFTTTHQYKYLNPTIPNIPMNQTIKSPIGQPVLPNQNFELPHNYIPGNTQPNLKTIGEGSGKKENTIF